MNRRPFSLRTLGWILTLAILCGCSTVQYRGIQGDFERAVRAELEGADLPFVDWYRSVALELTPGYIGKLAPQLQPNAWLLRSLAQWRIQDFDAADQSARAGLDTIAALERRDARWSGSRDKILLTMAPGLVKDAELRSRFLKGGTNDLKQHLGDVYQPELIAALNEFKNARSLVGEDTPDSVIVYWNFQTWRLLQNWATYCTRLPMDDQPTALASAAQAIQSNFSDMLGGAKDLRSARDYLKAQLGANHPYFQLVERAAPNQLLGP